MDKQQKIAYFHSVLFMLLSPAYSLFHGLKGHQFSYDAKRWLLILFITIYGSTITLNISNDGYRHHQHVVEHYVGLSFGQFLSEMKDIILFIDNPNVNEDLYIHFLSYLVGGILQAPDLFFVFVAFIYGYFFAGSIFGLLKSHKRQKYPWLFYIFLIAFLLWKNIEGINTVRTWTGLWILFYACIHYYQTKKKKYMFLMFVPPMVHVGYFIMAIPAWSVLFFGVKHRMYGIIFALSFVVNAPSFFLTSTLQKTEVGTEKVEAYKIEEVPENSTLPVPKKKNEATWYRQAFKLGVQNWAVSITAGALIIFGVYKKQMTYLESHLFSIGILTMSLSNFTEFLFALNNRSALIAGLFLLACLILMFRSDYFNFAFFRKKRMFLNILKISGIMLLPIIIFQIADLIYYVSIYILVFPFVPWFTDDLNYSIRELIGLFL